MEWEAIAHPIHAQPYAAQFSELSSAIVGIYVMHAPGSATGLSALSSYPWAAAIERQIFANFGYSLIG